MTGHLSWATPTISADDHATLISLAPPPELGFLDCQNGSERLEEPGFQPDLV